MSILSPPLPQPPLRYPAHKITVDEYHRLIQTGVLTEDDQVELLEGRIVPKIPRNPPHDGTIQVANEVLSVLLPAGWKVRIQSAVTLVDSEPEPDLAIVRGSGRDFLTRHPAASDIGLIIEVADSSLAHDRVDKGQAYAAAGIGIYWIINLADLQIEVYTDPMGAGSNARYRNRHDNLRADTIHFVLAGQTLATIAVTELIP